MASSAIGSSAAVGSSSIINGASLYTARAIAIFWLSPPDISTPVSEKSLYK